MKVERKSLRGLLLRIVSALIWDRSRRHAFREKHFVNEEKAHCHIGRHTYYGRNFVVMHPATTIGAFCSIGDNVALGPSQHPTNWLSTSPFQYAGNIPGLSKRLSRVFAMGKRGLLTARENFDYPPCHVGNDVWIGSNAVVEDGVTIGDGAIVASNAVVTHDIPPYAIVGGVPARVIRMRFDEKIISQLVALKWWERPDDTIAELNFDDISSCLATLSGQRSG